MKFGLEHVIFGILNLANKYHVQLLLDDGMDTLSEIIDAFIEAVACNEVQLKSHLSGYEPLPRGGGKGRKGR